MAEFGDRISYAVEKLGGLTRASKALDVPSRTLQRWAGGETEPSASHAIRIARKAGVDLEWLISGEGAPEPGDHGFVTVPRYDVRLAAGDGAFLDRARKLDDIPFTRDFLRKKLGRPSADGLAIFEARGVSMEPTICDGDLVMVDLRQTDLQDDIFAFTRGDELRLKRLHRLIDGVEIISDNATLYKPEVFRSGKTVPLPDDLRAVEEAVGGYPLPEPYTYPTGLLPDDFQIIGRIIWVGRVL